MKFFYILACLLLIVDYSFSQCSYEKFLKDVNPFWQNKHVPNHLGNTLILTEKEKISLHLRLVEKHLRKNTPSFLNQEQLKNRIALLDTLNNYIATNTFPLNFHFAERTPVFIDELNTYCAVGYLISKSGYDSICKIIQMECNLGTIYQLASKYTLLQHWADSHGFLMEELAWVQPAYGSIWIDPIQHPSCFSTDSSWQFVVTDANCACNGSVLLPKFIPNTYQLVSQASMVGGGFGYTCGSLCPGIYTITLVDQNSNSYFHMVSINNSSDPQISSTANTCQQYPNGKIMINNYDSLASYVCQLGNSTFPLNSNHAFENLAGGLYTITYFKINGLDTCTLSYNIQVANNLLQINTYYNSPLACFGDSNMVAIMANGGIPPYNGIGNVSYYAGTHIVTVTDNLGCMVTDTVVITQPPPLNFTKQLNTPILCAGDSALYQLLPFGGTPPYIGNTTLFLTQGIHTINFVDNNGCNVTDTVQVYSPSPLTSQINITQDIKCYGDTAEIMVTALGGTAPYIGTGNYYTNLGGYLSFNIIDDNGCSHIDSVLLPTPTPISYNFTTTADNGNANGSAEIFVSGGIPPYTFQWNSGENSSGIYNKIHGYYHVHFKDSLLCERNDSLEIPLVFPATNVDQSLNQDVNIYPIPANEFLFVSSQNKNVISLELKSISDQNILTKNCINNPCILEVKDLPFGMYFIKINTKMDSSHRLIIIQH